MRILIADNSAVIRTLLEEYFAQDGGITTVSSVPCSADVAGLIRRKLPDIVLFGAETDFPGGFSEAQSFSATSAPSPT